MKDLVLSEWFETNRYRADDGLVHIVAMQTVGGMEGTTNVHQCRSKSVEQVDQQTPITCLTCLAYKGG